MRALSLLSLSMKFSGLMSLHFVERRRARSQHVNKASPPACQTARAQQVHGSRCTVAAATQAGPVSVPVADAQRVCMPHHLHHHAHEVCRCRAHEGRGRAALGGATGGAMRQ